MLKEALVVEALLPMGDRKATHRSVAEQWEAIGQAPRDARPKLEGLCNAPHRVEFCTLPATLYVSDRLWSLTVADQFANRDPG